MNALSYFTEGQVKKILSSLVFLTDTREQKNDHIIDYFNSKGLNHEKRGLDSGDYSIMIPAIPELGIVVPQAFNKPIPGGIFIERKGSLDELAGNLGVYRERFTNEMERMKQAEKHLLIEDGNWEQISAHNYRSQLKPESYLNSLVIFATRYNLKIHFVSKAMSGEMIRRILVAKVKETFRL